MKLTDKIKMIDDMIKENPDCTVKDYLEVLTDVESIEKGGLNMPYPGLSNEERERILKLAAQMNVSDIRRQTNLAFSTIYAVLKSEGINMRKVVKERKAIAEKEAKEQERNRMEELKKRLQVAQEIAGNPQDQQDKKFQRPPAEYSNHSPWNIAS